MYTPRVKRPKYIRVLIIFQRKHIPVSHSLFTFQTQEITTIYIFFQF